MRELMDTIYGKFYMALQQYNGILSGVNQMVSMTILHFPQKPMRDGVNALMR